MTATKANGEDEMKKAKITFERIDCGQWIIRANDREAGCLFRYSKTGDWHWLAGFSDDAGYKLSWETHIDLPNGIPVHAAKRLVRDAIQNTGSVVHHTGRFNDRGDEVVVAIITTQEGSGPAVCALTNEDAPRLVHLHRPLIDRFAGEDAERDESERESFIAWTIRAADKGLAASYSWISEEGALDRDFVRPTETETETCSDCDGDALRLDTTTGSVDCVDCGNETETMTTFIAYDIQSDRILGYTRATSKRSAVWKLKRQIKARFWGGRFGIQTVALSDFTERSIERAGGFAIPRPADVQADMNAAFGWEA